MTDAKCDHMVGVENGWETSHWYQSDLIKAPENIIYIDILFKYCPMCGEELTYD